jgi:glycosyltransferase involved in cell wall biosynthesis
LFIVESLASGVPVVQPELGAFPELVNLTGGGVLYDAADPAALVRELDALLRDPDRARELGRAGRAAVAKQFSVEVMARRLIGVYEEIVS